MKKILIALSLILSLPMFIQAQNVSVPYSLRSGERQQEKSERAERNYDFFVGGNINNNFGYQIALMAEGGVRIIDMFTLGVGPRYEVIFNPYMSSVYHCYGGSAFGEFTLLDYVILHVGYEYLNYPYVDYDNMTYRHNVHAVAAGIGFNSNTMISSKLSIYAMYILYPYHSDRQFEFSLYKPFPMFARIGVRYYF
ncbi:MAG: hypothetical protein K6A41_08690 [Bacteroidales bacterium]|nr:hypothetical protein [Bacteroidales bacterium]